MKTRIEMQPQFERLLDTVRGSVTHGQLVDIRENAYAALVARGSFGREIEAPRGAREQLRAEQRLELLNGRGDGSKGFSAQGAKQEEGKV